MFRLEPQSLDFVETAPLRVSDSAVVRAPAAKVFEVFADTESWPAWFPLMQKARWVGKETSGVGAEREVGLLLLGKYTERFLAWEPGKRFAFTMTKSSSPLANAIAEDFRFTEVDGGKATRIDWVLAARPRLIGRALRPVLETTMKRVFKSSGPRLEKYIARSR